jgi:flagellar protein FliO/FliZ
MLELAEFSRAVIGLGIVLLLIAGVLWLLRRFAPQAMARGGGGRRLAVVESLVIDPRTRLVMVRRDAREHLLLVTASGAATLVESLDGQAPASPLETGR